MAHPISNGDVKRIDKHISINPEAVDLWYKKHGGRASFSDWVCRLVFEDVGYRPPKPLPPPSFEPEPDEFGNIFFDKSAWRYYKRYGMPPKDWRERKEKKEKEEQKQKKTLFSLVLVGVAA
jgi:hypothetical protein